MPFFCVMCGECCSQMGDVHVVEEEYGQGRFLMLNRYTGERHRVEIDPALARLYPDRRIYERWPGACPFLREKPRTGENVCIIHRTRPDICQEYRCWRLLILNEEGVRAGRVMERRHLAADDPALKEFWEQTVAVIREDDIARWDERVTGLLERAGYTVRR
ncbi:YkgJ family cysteine cluster protein [Methanofollis fontis]|uniref:Zinc/iron-chelating domain-containing protein n=1 Tax=Methanofollis fontis TaxID=2052832 RepID=A0A483CXF9_9EURY|nr:YkgJ family cysteine cluster protein [Methanofollis fontis]TAJ43953.1 hypothetical protein CUJ86_07825 [Methanofollis fontis]